jgi:hypothetical protein
MFNAARGSLLIAALFHTPMNGPAWPDAQPWDVLGFVVVALVVVWANRRAMLTRGTGATHVLMPTTRRPSPESSRRSITGRTPLAAGGHPPVPSGVGSSGAGVSDDLDRDYEHADRGPGGQASLARAAADARGVAASTMTCHPRRASSPRTARPRPRDPPVTRATCG